MEFVSLKLCTKIIATVYNFEVLYMKDSHMECGSIPVQKHSLASKSCPNGDIFWEARRLDSTQNIVFGATWYYMSMC
jgi:hypothetical protein